LISLIVYHHHHHGKCHGCTYSGGAAAHEEILKALATIDIKKENQMLEIRCDGRGK
jgi:hypothetical protein